MKAYITIKRWILRLFCKNSVYYINGNETPLEVLGYSTEEEEFGGDVFDRSICTYGAAGTYGPANSVSFTCANTTPASDKLYAALGVNAYLDVASIDDVRYNLDKLSERVAQLEDARNPSPMVTSRLRGALKTLQYKREVE